MPIGETLAQARHEAGLTVAQVSVRTRIRQAIIRKIEEDDYSTCGGDFYARGHIRAIAKAVGTDPEPLIQEYDTVHRAPGALATVSLDELLATSGHAAQRRRPDLPAAWARVTAAGAQAGRKAGAPARRKAGAPPGDMPGAPAGGATSTPAGGMPGAPAGGMPGGMASAPAGRKAGRGATGRRVESGRAPRRRRRTVGWAVFVALALAVVVAGFVALRLLAGSSPAAPSAAREHAATPENAGHTQPGPAAQASQSAAAPAPVPVPSPSHSGAPSPAAAQPAQPLTPVRATAFGPNGGDNPQLAHLVLGIRHASGWHTDWYTSARFGNLYPGTGLLLAMGQRVAISSARINLGNTTGASFQLRVGARPALADLPAVARATGAGGVVRLHLARPARGRYVLLWFTRLPTDSAGTFRAHIYDVSLQGHR